MKNIFARLFSPAPLGRIPACLDKNSEFQLEVSACGKLSIVRTQGKREQIQPLGITAARALSLQVEEIFNTRHSFATRYKEEAEYIRFFVGLKPENETFRILFLRSDLAKLTDFPE